MFQSTNKKLTDADFTDKVGTNIVHPLGAGLFGLCALWSIIAPRKYVVWAVLFIACFVSPAQRFAFLGADFDFLRAITVLILCRILVLGELRNVRIRAIDYCVLGFVTTMIIGVTIRTGGARTINELGQTVDGLGLYLIGRALIRNLDDLKSLMVGAFICSVPVMIFFTIEQMTGRNYFSVLGGVSEMTQVRQGKLRAQGAFTHPIIAGLFWATFFALFIGLIRAKTKSFMLKIGGWIGAIASVIIVVMTNSSTPLAGLLVATVGWLCFSYRWYLKQIRWAILFFMLFIHIIHTKGVHFFVFVNFNPVSGSTGRHRAMLIDGVLKNIPDWALFGSSRRYNRAFRDITCDYVYTAVQGGMIPLIFELAVITLAFYACGRAIRAARNREELNLVYGVGVAVLTVCVMSTAVSVYGQAEVPFFMTFGIAASLGNLEWIPKIRPRPAHLGHQPEEPSPQPAVAEGMSS